ncbi:C-X-C chemokine receptor type 5 [Xyrichtys novacula]|uniref:C-X-C chemokine receptor type 5 n=1 Tax=Xyrichtys novacula TaxID=13765 RepID=A0AAV1FTS4_XYRNO|nr:C-X-C chemokine receptor type 5 [Xyrichtys novacula]
MAVTEIFTTLELPDTNETDYIYNDTGYIYDIGTDYLCDDEVKGLQTFYVVIQPMLYCLIFLLGVIGNGLMITVLLGRWRHLRITEVYLLHLALTDLMLLFTLPFSVVESVAGWLFGGFLCKMVGVLKNLNLLCGSFLLACIGFDRYLAIVRAIPSLQSRRLETVHLACFILWLFCLAFTIPHAVFLSVKADPRNSSRLSCLYYEFGIHAHNWVLTSRVLDHVCFFLPLAAMSYCYTAVVVTLFKSQRSKAKQGAIRLALLITLVFCFCWLPYNITLLVKTLVDMQVFSYSSCALFVSLQPVLDVTQSLGFSHCCLNPFLYAFVGVRFRNELLKLLSKMGCGRVCQPFIRGQGYSRPSVSEGTTSISTTHATI